MCVYIYIYIYVYPGRALPLEPTHAGYGRRARGGVQRGPAGPREGGNDMYDIIIIIYLPLSIYIYIYMYIHMYLRGELQRSSQTTSRN